eukprot:296047-Heterocapsa_arctica.AAC.1
MGLQGGHGGQCGVEGLQQYGQVSREVRDRTQDCRSRASAFRDDRVCILIFFSAMTDRTITSWVTVGP